MRLVICWILIAILVSGCAACVESGNVQFEDELLALSDYLAEQDEGMLKLQMDLVSWYNLNVHLNHGTELQGAYDEILYFQNGMMGSLLIPDLEIHLPIYHGISNRVGFGHDPNTGFPVGTDGQHSALWMYDLPALAAGDQFTIEILDLKHTYEVIAVREHIDTTAVPGYVYCSLMDGAGTQYLGILVNETE